MEYSNTYAKIRLDIIGENYRAICQKAGKPVMAVVKADAYGHGAVAVAKYLEKDCPFFGVSSPAEALQLRSAGIAVPILVLGHSPRQVLPALVAEDIRPTVCSLEDAKALSEAAIAQGKTAQFHIAVDTGMSRIGFQVDAEAANICREICSLPGIAAEGLFSHFATADTDNLEKTHRQAALFREFDRMLLDRGVDVKIRHLDNSAGIAHFGCSCQMARAGIILYGLYPSDEVDQKLLTVKPALSWYATVSHIKWLPAGREISYGGTFITTKPTRVATVSAGYADGYRRSLSGAFYVLLHGKKAPILGRVCMDQFMVDVTDIPEAEAEDAVVLLGVSGQEEITAEMLGKAAGSFAYEQLCDLSHRVSRVFYEGDREVGRTNYLL